MGTRKKTLRRKPEMTRKYLRLLNELESVLRRLKNMEYDIQDAEMCTKALEQQGREQA